MKRLNFWAIIALLSIFIVNVIGQFAFPYCAWIIGNNPSFILNILGVLFLTGFLISIIYGFIRKEWSCVGGVCFILFISLLSYSFRIGFSYRGDYQGDYILVNKTSNGISLYGLADKWGKVVVPFDYLCLCTVMNNSYNEEMVLGVKYLSDGYRNMKEQIFCNNYECHLYRDNKLFIISDTIIAFDDIDGKFENMMDFKDYININIGKIVKDFNMWIIENEILYEGIPTE